MSDNIEFPTPTLVPVPGGALEVFEAGHNQAGQDQAAADQGKGAIVLCHGWPEHAFVWRHQIAALAQAGYHVIVPNQRGFGRSLRPDTVEAYDIAHLTGDLVALLDHYGYGDAVFVGGDWGANVVWSLCQLWPDRVRKAVALSLPYQPRGSVPWVEMIEGLMGADNYIVHFNRHPGVADAVLDANGARFLRNLFRTHEVPPLPEPGNAMINLALAEEAQGAPVMSEAALDVFVQAFAQSGFTAGINWYRNMDRNWHLLADVDPVIHQPALMIYGARDVIPQAPYLRDLVPNVREITLDCGHWVAQEKPSEVNAAILDWLAQGDAGAE